MWRLLSTDNGLHNENFRAEDLIHAEVLQRQLSTIRRKGNNNVTVVDKTTVPIMKISVPRY